MNKSRNSSVAKYPALLGIGELGCSSLTNQALEILSQAQILAGKKDFLDFFPDFTHERLEMPLKDQSVSETLTHLFARSKEENVVILASGDPNFFGIAKLARRYWKHLNIIPNLSSMQIAFARVNESWHDAIFHSVHGRGDIFGLASRIRNQKKVCILTDPKNSPARLAQHLLEFHQADWSAFVCENLSEAATESITQYDNLTTLANQEKFAALNLLILLRKKEKTATNTHPASAKHTQSACKRRSPLHLSETAYHRKIFRRGLITKKEVRILSIAALELGEESIVWDIGAASGSIAIESGRWATSGSVYAIETDAQCLEHLHENVRLHQADNIRIIAGMAPSVLKEIDQDPDSIFIGGSKGNLPAIIDTCYARLKRPGKLVINAVTLENIATCLHELKKIASKERQYLADRYPAYTKEKEPEHTKEHTKEHTNVDVELEPIKMKQEPEEILAITMVQVSRAVPLSLYLRYDAQNPIHIFTLSKQLKPAA